MEFEVGIHDGAYLGRLHSHVPFIGRKTFTVRQKTYNDIHGYYRAQVEHLFAFGLGWSCMIFCSGPMKIRCFCHVHVCFPRGGGFQGGYGKVEPLFGAVRALCRKTQ